MVTSRIWFTAAQKAELWERWKNGQSAAAISRALERKKSDPLAKGYVKSFARPGGNMTGMFLDLPELSGKQVAVLRLITRSNLSGRCIEAGDPRPLNAKS